MKKDIKKIYILNAISLLLVGLGLIILIIPIVKDTKETYDSLIIIAASVLLITGSGIGGYSLTKFNKKK
ncbi:MAG: hypothetical protein PHQ89_00695 [Bacilli bacterium]|nr:hypothetical protein [Bacilli bacterium]